MKKQIVLFLAIFGICTITYCFYIAPEFYEMVGASDLVIHGTINEVKESTFILETKEVLVGDYSDSKIEINKFVDWTCSMRWKPYEVGQEIIAFIHILPEAYLKDYTSKYKLMSAGSEGEFPIIDNYVYSTGFSFPSAPHVEGKPMGENKFKQNVMLSAIRDYKNLFELKYDRNKRNKVLEIKIIGDENTINRYKETSLLHKYLVESTIKQKNRIERE